MSTLWTPGGEHPVDGGGQPAPPAAPNGDDGQDDEELSAEEQAQLESDMAAMQEELARTPAAVVVANHAVGLFQLAAIHLNQRPPNLDEGRLAIDALAALVEGTVGRLGGHEQGLKDGLAQLRLAYVQLAGPGGEPA